MLGQPSLAGNRVEALHLATRVHLFTTVSFQIMFSFLICAEEEKEEKIAWQLCIWKPAFFWREIILVKSNWIKIRAKKKLFSLLTCLHTTTLTLLCIFSPLEIIGIKMWETPLSWHAVPVSKTRVLKLPDFTLLFCGVWQRCSLKCVPHVQHNDFFLFNPIIF